MDRPDKSDMTGQPNIVRQPDTDTEEDNTGVPLFRGGPVCPSVCPAVFSPCRQGGAKSLRTRRAVTECPGDFFRVQNGGD